MVRSFGIGLVVLGMACAGPARSQQPAPATTAGAGERIMVLQEKGAAGQRCRVLRSWQEPDGSMVHQVQALGTGKIMTVVVTGSAPGSGARAMTTRIYHWGDNNIPPPGTPTPPQGTTAATATPRPASLPYPSVGRTTPSETPTPPTSAGRPAPSYVQATPTAPVNGPPPTPYSKWPTMAQNSPPVQTTQRPAPLPVSSSATSTPVSRPYLLVSPTPSSPPAPGSSGAPASGQRLTPQGGTCGTAITPCPSCQLKPNVSPCPSCQLKPIVPPCSSCQVKPSPCPTSPCPCGSPSVAQAQPLPVTTSVITRCPDCATVPPRKDPAPVVDPAPPRPGPFARLFGSSKDQGCACACTPCTNPVVLKPVPSQPSTGAKPSGVAQSTTPPAGQTTTKPGETTVQRPTEPAEPGDFRESWGQARSWKPTVPQPEAAPVKKRKPSKTPPQPTPTGTTTAREDNPPDPVKNPEYFHQQALTALQAKQATSVARAPAPSGPPAGWNLTRRQEMADKSADRMGLPAGAVVDSDRPGAQSVLAARTAAGDGSAAEPSEEVANAFSFPPMPATPPPPPPNPYPPARPVYERPMPADVGVPSGMANAFTLSNGTARPIPADFGSQALAANAFTPPEQRQPDGTQSPPPGGVNGFSLPFPPQGLPPGAAVAMAGMPGMPGMPGSPMGPAGYRPGMLPAASQVPAGPSAPQLLSMLRDSLYPSQREWAAEGLSRQDWRTQPQVVQGLLTAAREDPAATVRAGCVRALAHMRVNTLPVVSAVQALKADTDPRVRQEVEEALPALGIASEAQPDANVRPAALPDPVGATK